MGWGEVLRSSIIIIDIIIIIIIIIIYYYYYYYYSLLIIIGVVTITIISIYKLGDVGISSNLIGSLSLTNGHCPPPGRWIMKQWPA